jgi:hypothetical protein
MHRWAYKRPRMRAHSYKSNCTMIAYTRMYMQSCGCSYTNACMHVHSLALFFKSATVHLYARTTPTSMPACLDTCIYTDKYKHVHTQDMHKSVLVNTHARTHEYTRTRAFMHTRDVRSPASSVPQDPPAALSSRASCSAALPRDPPCMRVCV